MRYLGLGGDPVDYREAWDLQHRLHAEVVAGQAPDTLLLLEHAPVYTAGKRTEPHERPLDGTPVIDVDRGGKITWHGPGQLVGYPLVRLPEAFGVVDYVRRLEQALIDALAEVGLSTGRVPGRSGVWLAADPSNGRPERKVAAIGVRVAGGVTMHGFALNADPDMRAYDRIVPCGIADAGVTSITAELGSSPALTSLAYVLVPHLERLLAFEPYERTPDVADLAPAASSGVTYGLTASVR
ncbi:lipoyl(octanoyl) transferase [Microlunatus flavus]|uniref:Octanoyltransferase n=1 Tax=Microlunatus flavus TaxID=1036181 RepID=A0A1H9KJX7_9ACTN|nr:lipoyl(octanoyl) transferase [Microlunatus flavus]